MKYNLPIKAEKGIIELAEKYGIEKVILFGSRARGDNRERSDIDIAVTGGDITGFFLDVDEEIESLLMFDVVDLDNNVQPELLKEIERDDVTIYEKKER
ncbi:MAG: nucleotidyltransferase domain-containing protein [Oscillospiraceae bacterium]|nr:nucleotidyltransferase domain-containing protein [Oscillospiraceae bacterium]